MYARKGLFHCHIAFLIDIHASYMPYFYHLPLIKHGVLRSICISCRSVVMSSSIGKSHTVVRRPDHVH